MHGTHMVKGELKINRGRMHHFGDIETLTFHSPNMLELWSQVCKCCLAYEIFMREYQPTLCGLRVPAQVGVLGYLGELY